jgi:hypothetical protein
MAAAVEVPWRSNDLPGVCAQIAEARDANVQLTGSPRGAGVEAGAGGLGAGGSGAVEARLEGAVQYQVRRSKV